MNGTLNAIEHHIRIAYAEMKRKEPKLRRVTFEIADGVNRILLQGYYHIGGGCESYDSIDELKPLMGLTRTNEILFRKF